MILPQIEGLLRCDVTCTLTVRNCATDTVVALNTLSFDRGTSIDTVQAALERARTRIPDGCQADPPVVCIV